jgi:hypothetical protein
MGVLTENAVINAHRLFPGEAVFACAAGEPWIEHDPVTDRNVRDAFPQLNYFTGAITPADDREFWIGPRINFDWGTTASPEIQSIQ